MGTPDTSRFISGNGSESLSECSKWLSKLKKQLLFSRGQNLETLFF